MKGQLELNKRNRLIEDSLLLSSMAPELYYTAIGLMGDLQSRGCRILTQEDKALIPVYLELFSSRLRDIASLYPEGKIEEAIAQYTQDFMQQHLTPNKSKRFVGHFTNDSLDGILIEGFDEPFGIQRTLINWVMARQSGLGIGTALAEDCIQRARKEGKQVVSLVVSSGNVGAQRVYSRLGFKPDSIYDEGRMVLMNYHLK
ncbi:GNAT family N-acetyltransferase [Candidatus Woesearchaeota archaeon]|nr:GNAT family N-acetyltransferase [Candidatus Woesearchaeota archaeon]